MCIRDSGYIVRWFESCADLPIRPFVQRSFISSYNQKESFEDIFMSMDAILVGGGNTLNMIAIWKAQGMDIALRKAWEHGVVLGGGSAGSLCWFEQGTTDSRPGKLTTVEAVSYTHLSNHLLKLDLFLCFQFLNGSKKNNDWDS